MQTVITMDSLRDYAKTLDVRLQEFTTAQINSILDIAFIELNNLRQIFVDVELVDLEGQSGTVVIDMNKPVVDVYDFYLAKEYELYPDLEGIEVDRDENTIYRDNLVAGRIHVDTSRIKLSMYKAIIKYFYIPVSSLVSFQVDIQGRPLIETAIAVAAYDAVHDVQRSEQKRAMLMRLALISAINPPEDFKYRKASMFPYGV